MIIDKYIQGRITQSFILSILFVSGALLLIQIMRVLMLIGGVNAGIWPIIVLASMLIPSALFISMPILLTLSVFMTYFSMLNNSEIIAMRSFGVSDSQLLKPIIRNGFVFSLLCLLLGCVLSPYCQQKFRSFNNTMQARYALSVLKKKTTSKFNQSIVYIDDIQDNSKLKKMIILENKKDKYKLIYIKDAKLRETNDGILVDLYQFTISETDNTTDQNVPLIIKGNFASVKLANLLGSGGGTLDAISTNQNDIDPINKQKILKKPKEMYLPELISTIFHKRSLDLSYKTELNTRLSWPINTLSISLTLGLIIISFTGPRMVNKKRKFVIISLLISFITISSIVIAPILSKSFGLSLLIYIYPIFYIMLTKKIIIPRFLI